MAIWKQKVDIAGINTRGKVHMHALMGVTVTDIGEDFLSVSMDVDEDKWNPYGILHGGAQSFLADSAAHSAAHFCIEEGYFCVGLEFNINYISSVTKGKVIATARPIHMGSKTHIWGVDIRDENNKLISVARVTMLVVKKP